MKVKVIGLGGVGIWLIEPLCMYLQNSKVPPQLTLIDGDNYEEKNKDRQVFDRIGNKAAITMSRLEETYGRKIHFYHEPQYLDTNNTIEYIREGDIILACVDNHPSRLILSNRCEQLKNVACISGGNEFHDGGVQCHIRQKGVNVTLPLANDFHPEVQKPPEDNHPLRLQQRRGCDTVVESEPQLVFTNFMVASVMLNAFYALVQGKLNYDEAYLDVQCNLIRTVQRKENKNGR